MFNGFFNFDAKFWRTIIPLLINPGKVTTDYVAGKRQRYTNPFRFYLTVSIIFFLIVGMVETKNTYEKLSSNHVQKIDSLKKKKKVKILNQQEIDSVKKEVKKQLNEAVIPIPKKVKKEILKEIDREVDKEIKKNKNKRVPNINAFGFDLGKMRDFYEDHKDLKTDASLDSLGLEKNFKHRFVYQRVKRFSNVFDNETEQNRFGKEIISHGSIALFVFLPFFTLFLKLFYIRRKFTYVDHLIFAFHTQTVLFMVFGLFLVVSLFIDIKEVWVPILLFLLYLYLAMKKFYNQGYVKTFFKFLFLNFWYFMLGILGTILIAVLSFAIY